MRKLSPKIEEWLNGYNKLLEKLKENGFTSTSTNAREGLANLTATLVSGKPAVPWIQDDLVEGEQFDVPVRMYHPQPEVSLPLLIYFHGGGHMAGSVSVYDPIFRRIARAVNHIVVAPDYRLAPECPYPAGITDALTVVRYIWKTLDRRTVNYKHQLSIAGDSAGGAISATVSHTMQHEPDVSISRQVLIYPSLDYTMKSNSLAVNGQGYLLEREKIKWYFDNYFQSGEERRNCSPLFMEFTGRLPASFVITAEFCPLCDEALEYLIKLEGAGVSSRHLHYSDMIHAFMNMEDIAKEQCKKLYAEMAEFLNAPISSQSLDEV